MIDYITYQKKKYPIRMTKRAVDLAIAELKGSRNISIEESQELDYSPDYQEALLWHSLRAGARFAGEDLALEKSDMEWVLDECYTDYLRLNARYSREIMLALEKGNKEAETMVNGQVAKTKPAPKKK